jgi:hypothetical protein
VGYRAGRDTVHARMSGRGRTCLGQSRRARTGPFGAAGDVLDISGAVSGRGDGVVPAGGVPVGGRLGYQGEGAGAFAETVWACACARAHHSAAAHNSGLGHAASRALYVAILRISCCGLHAVRCWQTADETIGKHMSTWEYSITVTPRPRPPPLGSPLPHLHRYWARPCHICTDTGLATSAPGLGSPLPPLHRYWAHPCHICTGTWLATSAPAAALHTGVLDHPSHLHALPRRAPWVGTHCTPSAVAPRECHNPPPTSRPAAAVPRVPWQYPEYPDTARAAAQ